MSARSTGELIPQWAANIAGSTIPANLSLYLSYMERHGIWYQIKRYLYLRKKDPNEPRNTNIFLMHGMNRISIIVFLIAIIILIFRALTR